MTANAAPTACNRGEIFCELVTSGEQLDGSYMHAGVDGMWRTPSASSKEDVVT